jgi:hypothetical protein
MRRIFFNIGDIIAGTIVGYLVYRFSGENDDLPLFVKY